MGLEREQRKIYVNAVGITISLFWDEKYLKSLQRCFPHQLDDPKNSPWPMASSKESRSC